VKQSRYFLPTLRDLPADAEVRSHQLMLRAGLMRQLAAGVYTYLPFGYQTLKKVIDIVREEMDHAGAQELLMPALQPAELWHQTGRWDDYGPLMMKVTDRHGRLFALGPTHEEVITSLVRDEIKSYKKLPLVLYQIQNKFRDEYRPRSGVLRGREFIMKDAYSFDVTEEGLDRSYTAMYEAYIRIFKRCGLNFRAVEADSGSIGGKSNHEFMGLTEIGEDTILYCTSCNYAANIEKAEVVYISQPSGESPSELSKVTTPGIRTVAEQAKYMKLPVEKIIKCILLLVDQEPVLVLVRGDHEVNEAKVRSLLDADSIQMADEELIMKLFNTKPGFVGPIGINSVKIIADHAVKDMVNASTGANQTDYHYLNVNPERDFHVDLYGDLRTVKEGDRCPKCGAKIEFARGIEVGHVFKLGTKYSRAMGAVYQDENGQQQEMLMGCYGIGISRTVAAIIEQNHDEDGIIWPKEVAPFLVHIVPVNYEDDVQREVADAFYTEFKKAKIDVLLDDRKERAGVKFKDSDLIGIPLRITIGAKAREGMAEIKVRSSGESFEVKIEDVKEKIVSLLDQIK